MELLVLISIILIVILFFFGWKYDEVWMKRFEIFMYDSMKYGFHYSFRHLKNDLVALWQRYIQKKDTKKIVFFSITYHKKKLEIQKYRKVCDFFL